MTYIYIKYRKNGFGPYLARFENQSEAMEWLKANEVEVEAIDFIDE